MAAKNLLSSEMLMVSERWVSEKLDQPLLGSVPVLAAMAPMIVEAHKGLLDAQRAAEPGADAKELAELSAKGGELDQLHDRKGRGAWKLLDGLAELADTPDEAAHYTALRDRVLPDGVSMLQLSWMAEAGNVEVLDRALKGTGLAQELAAVPLPGKKLTLLDAVKTHVSAGRRLGVIEARRGVIDDVAKSAKTADGAVTKPLTRARNQWIRVVNAVLTNLDLVPDLDDAVRSAIVGPYLRAEQAADRRAIARRAPDEPADPT
jgi:hypothetical protein